MRWDRSRGRFDMNSPSSEPPLKETFLELVHWKTLDEWNARETVKAKKHYETFDEVASAIDELELSKSVQTGQTSFLLGQVVGSSTTLSQFVSQV